MNKTLISMVLSAGVVATPAHALRTSYCTPAQVLPSGGEVPANLPGFLWSPGYVYEYLGGLETTFSAEPEIYTADWTRVEARITDPRWPVGTSYPKDMELLVELSAQLEPGQQYSIRLESCSVNATGGSPTGSSNSTFIATKPAALPTRLGTLSATRRGVGQEDVYVGSSYEVLGLAFGRVSVALTLFDEAAPWKDVFKYETLVDGKPGGYQPPPFFVYNPISKWTKRGFALLTTHCDDERMYPDDSMVGDDALAPGKHKVAFRASIPGTDVVLVTDEIEVGLDCEAADSGQARSADNPEVVEPELDGDSAAIRSGCCSIGDAEREGAGSLVLLILAALLRRRR